MPWPLPAPTHIIAAGELDQRVRLETKAVSQNGYGEDVESWATLDTVWAKVTPAAGEARYRDEPFHNDQHGFDPERRSVFRIRYRDDITIDVGSTRIVYRDETYDINAIVRVGRNVALDIFARAHVA